MDSRNIPDINSATGLPMVGGVDVGGNPYGTSRANWQGDSSEVDDVPWDEHSPAEKVRTIVVMGMVIGFIGFVLILT